MAFVQITQPSADLVSVQHSIKKGSTQTNRRATHRMPAGVCLSVWRPEESER